MSTKNNAEIYFTYKELATAEDGTEVLLTPRDNPNEFEFPINFIWYTVEEAKDFLVTEAENWSIKPEESNKWILVKVTTERV